MSIIINVSIGIAYIITDTMEHFNNKLFPTINNYNNMQNAINFIIIIIIIVIHFDISM